MQFTKHLYNKITLLFLMLSLSQISFSATLKQFENAAEQDEGIQYFINNAKPNFSPDVPTPYQVLGYNVGQQYPDWNDVLRYMEALTKSDRVSIKYFGKTYQNRRFEQVYISTPENIQNLETIRKKHLAVITNAMQGQQTASNDLPLVVNLMASIHGNEASGVGAAINAAYYFTASNAPEVLELLKNTIIIITPGLNPDGINRFASWINTTASQHPVANLDSREFSEAWPSSRGNHYWADCNRDWMSIQHPEGANCMEMYRYWMPNVVLDMHEQGGTTRGFYFSPGDARRTYKYIPQKNQDLTLEISYSTGKALDAKNAKHFSQRGYDDFFIGKGAAYGDLLGSVCILHEQGASRGHLRPTPTGILSFKETIRNQTVAAIGVTEAAFELKDKLQNYRKEFFVNQEKDVVTSPVKGYAFTAPDQGTEYHFLKMLRAHDFHIFENAQKQGEYVIPFEQNNYYLIKAFFENATEFSDSVFYDVSTWTQAHAFNMNVRPCNSLKGLLGKEVKDIQMKAGSMIGDASDLGYIFETNEFYAPYAANQLLKLGLTVKVSTESFKYAKKTFPAGTFVVLPPSATQKESDAPLSSEQLYTTLSTFAKERSLTIYALEQSKMGKLNLSDTSIKPISLPQIALITGSGMSSSQCGEIWYHLDARLDFNHTLIDYAKLKGVNLKKYNVMILADGYPTGLTPSNYLENLSKWIHNGGTLIVTGQGYHVSNDAKLTDIAYHKTGKADGLIMKSAFTATTPLAWGYKQTELPVFKKNANIYSTKTGTVVMQYAEKPYLSGCIADKAKAAIAGTPSAIIQPAGKGKVIFLADDLIWRSYWFGSSKILTNAILFNELF